MLIADNLLSVYAAAAAICSYTTLPTFHFSNLCTENQFVQLKLKLLQNIRKYTVPVYRARPILSLARSWGWGAPPPTSGKQENCPAPNFRRARELV